MLAKAVEDPALRQRVQNLATVIKANIQTRNEQRDRAARSGVRVGAYLARKLSEDKRIVAFREGQLKTLTQISDAGATASGSSWRATRLRWISIWRTILIPLRSSRRSIRRASCPRRRTF